MCALMFKKIYIHLNFSTVVSNYGGFFLSLMLSSCMEGVFFSPLC